jgi:hypothetical protein
MGPAGLTHESEMGDELIGPGCWFLNQQGMICFVSSSLVLFFLLITSNRLYLLCPCPSSHVPGPRAYNSESRWFTTPA